MDEEIARLHRRLHRSKIAVFAVVGAMLLMGFLIATLSIQISNDQASFELRSRASERYYGSEYTQSDMKNVYETNRRLPPIGPIDPPIEPTPTATPDSLAETEYNKCWGTATIKIFAAPACGTYAMVQCFVDSPLGPHQVCSKSYRVNSCVMQKDWDAFAQYECCSNPIPCSSNQYYQPPQNP